MDKYEINDNSDFQFIQIGERLHSIVVTYDYKIFINKSFVLLRDTVDSSQFQLNQIGISSYELFVSEANFIKLRDESNKIINQFKIKYGEPTKYVNNKDRYFDQINSEISGDIIAATWVSNDIKLKVTFSKDGEHGEYRYQLCIHKFQDYFGNVKLPEWWDGY